jgi:acetylserotonin N-methyltransferase
MLESLNAHQRDPDARLVLDIMDAFRASKAVFTAVSLRLFDRLHERSATVGDLAAELACPPHALERLLGACAGLGVLSVESGRFSNTPTATRFLRVESPETMTGYIDYSDRVLFRLWANLEDAIREGTHRWDQVFGSKEKLFDHFFANDDDKLTFLRGMHGHGFLSSPTVVAAFDLGRFTHMADLGGGTGHLVIEACRRYRDLRGTVYDLASVAPVAETYIAQAGLSDRIAAVAGDFFGGETGDALPEADLYAVSRILHDWSDEKVNRLLRRICESLPAGGALLICEKLLNETKDGPAGAYLQSLNMLICTEGRERTASEYEALVREAGFSGFEYRLTGQPVDAMLAVK